jgi:hypothetical protein
MPQVVGELDIDDKLEELIIPDIRVKIDVEQDEYVLKIRHEGLDNAVLAEWSCEGLTNSTHYILFNYETNEIINDEVLNGSGTYQESCPLGVLELCTFKQLTSICALGSS